jgi:hypothetical protein
MTQIPFSKIPSISNISRGEDTSKLFDGDFNSVYNPTSPSWQSMLNPVITEIMTDVKLSACIIREMRYVQQTGSDLGTKLYFILKTGEKKLVYSFNGQGGYQPDSWQVVPIPSALQVEVVRVVFEAPGGGPAYPNEIAFWGDYTEKQIVLKPRTPGPIANLLGFVCYPWNTAFGMWPSSMDAFTFLKPSRIRVYDDYGNIFENGNINLHWDQFNQYNTLKGLGVDVKDCIQNHPQYPYQLGDTRLDPATYLAFGRDLQKYAIANKSAGSPVRRIQAENEIDRSWKSPAEYMDGYAIAALCSACYDGHKGKYPDSGVKQIDSSVLFVNPGCATDKTQIIHQMRIWSIEHRGYRANGSVDFPFDVYEFHWYQSVGGQYAGKPGGMPVEIVIDRVQEMVDFFREYCPEMKIEIGEYGLDTHPDSDLNAPAYGKYTAQQTRGNWFVRDLMLFAKLGIDGADWYRETMDWQDDPSDPGGSTNIYDNSGQFFDTMDLIRPSHYAQPATYTRRIVGDYFRQIGEVLRMGFVFDSVVSTGPYVFKFTKSDATLYVLWTLETITWPTSGGRATFTEVVKTYTLNVKGTLYRFVDGADAMSQEAFNGGTVTVDAKPIMIIEGGSTPPPPLPTKTIFWRGYKDGLLPDKKRFFFIIYKEQTGFTIVQTNGKYQPL